MSRCGPSLSPKKLAILRHVAHGRTYPEIARRLNLSLEAVRWHLKDLRDRLGIRTKVGLALWAREHLCRQKHL